MKPCASYIPFLASLVTEMRSLKGPRATSDGSGRVREASELDCFNVAAWAWAACSNGERMCRRGSPRMALPRKSHMCGMSWDGHHTDKGAPLILESSASSSALSFHREMLASCSESFSWLLHLMKVEV